jgi:hypothetical protein
MAAFDVRAIVSGPSASGHYCQNKSKFPDQEIIAALAKKPLKNAPFGPLNRRLLTTYIA